MVEDNNAAPHAFARLVPNYAAVPRSDLATKKAGQGEPG
jgi:hypothetical protein